MVRVGGWSHERELGTGEVTALTTVSQYGLLVMTLDYQSRGRRFESGMKHLLCSVTKEKSGNNLAHFCNFLMIKFKIDIFVRFYLKGFLL